MELTGIGKMLIFVFVFLGCFVTLLALIPNQFAIATKEYSTFGSTIPDVWNGIDLLAYNFTGAWNFTIPAGEGWENFDIGGRNLRFDYVNTALKGKYLRLYHRYGFGLLWNEAMDWYNREGILKSYQQAGSATIGEYQLDEEYATYGDMKFNVICLGLGGGSSYFQVTTLFAFNTTLYSSPTEAWDNSALDILIGITFDQSSTALNAWYIVTSLLTFNTLEVFGNTGASAIAMNFILALPFWASIAFIAFVILMELIPF